MWKQILTNSEEITRRIKADINYVCVCIQFLNCTKADNKQYIYNFFPFQKAKEAIVGSVYIAVFQQKAKEQYRETSATWRECLEQVKEIFKWKGMGGGGS